MPGSLTVSVGVPGGAVELPLTLPTDGLAAWAEETARDRLGPEGEPRTVADLANALREATLDARRRGPVTALSFCPHPELGETARIEVSLIAPDAERPELTVKALADFLATPTERSMHPATVDYGDLPIGPAVRVRHQYVGERPATRYAGDDEGVDAAVEPDDGDPDEGIIVQTVAYAALPPGSRKAVLLFASWQALALDERLSELVDRLATTLRLEPADG
ncbi:hypothetical protein ABZ832_20795 [Streptantibioticus parmotrematis]|uniref:hypothetical protein n=1 Tax=Streptantibioticus parmotrematis TaxID=2873249 RepID=UPI0033C34D32